MPTMKKLPTKRRDQNQLAKAIVDLAVSEPAAKIPAKPKRAKRPRRDLKRVLGEISG